MRGSWACELPHMFAIFVGVRGGSGGIAEGPTSPNAVSAD
ncbi:hypothetical protein SFR_4289 [Streptomyces sp. FR-008]|nr:hypothetical protein SFR_4289 [Streptomyces sp. FR-008]